MDEECIGVDMYNLTLTGDVSMTLTGAASDSHHVPCVIAFDRAAYNQGEDAKFDFSVTENEIQPTITARGVGG